MKRWNRFGARWFPLLMLGTAAVVAHADVTVSNQPVAIDPSPAAPTLSPPLVIRVPQDAPAGAPADSPVRPIAPPAVEPARSPTVEAAGAQPRSGAASPAQIDNARQFDQQPLGAPPQARETDPAKLDSETSAGNYWLQTMFALGIVIALIFVLRWFLRRMSGTASVTGGAGLVEVLARTPIGHKTQILFLRVNERVIVAGQTPAGMNTLAEFDHPDDIAMMLQKVEASRPTSITQSFSSLLGQLDSNEDGRRDAGLDDSEHLIDRTREGLSGLARRIRSMRGEGDR